MVNSGYIDLMPCGQAAYLKISNQGCGFGSGCRDPKRDPDPVACIVSHKRSGSFSLYPSKLGILNQTSISNSVVDPDPDPR